MMSVSTTRLKQIAGMKLTEYFLKLCKSCLAEVKKNLKLIDPFGELKLALRVPRVLRVFVFQILMIVFTEP
jgi:hypothetical protein